WFCPCLCPERCSFSLFCQVWVIQPAVEAASCFADDIGKDIALCFVDLECLPSEKCHCFVLAAEGNDDQVRGNLSGCSDVVEFVGLMKDYPLLF
ncbi:hypothetical protein, partial [uncultured Limosilactobacillus sp.]|uniref:hypothetical protein n=1 Tax=uncultured Limosilactobacillus sp. TaxID=2837629 RepID=UPI00272D78D5